MDRQSTIGRAEEFAREGCLVAESLGVSPARLAKVRAALERTLGGARELVGTPKAYPWDESERGDNLVKIDNPHQTNLDVLDLCRDPAIVELAVDASGATQVQLWCSQIIVKLPNPRGAGNIGWHRDWDYWRAGFALDSELFTIWLALTDVASDSGPVRFVRGSHRWHIAGPGNFFSGDLQETRGLVESPGESWIELEGLLRVGGATVHDWRTIHGSFANTGREPRAGLAIHLRTNRTTLNEGFDPNDLGLDDLQKNPILSG